MNKHNNHCNHYKIINLYKIGGNSKKNKNHHSTSNDLNNLHTYEKTVKEPWFSLIKFGIKTVEGRLNKGEFSEMKIGDSIRFINYDLNLESPRKFTIKITNITNYSTFESYLKSETLQKCLPGIDNIDDGLKIYYSFYNKNDELKYGIRALTF